MRSVFIPIIIDDLFTKTLQQARTEFLGAKDC